VNFACCLCFLFAGNLSTLIFSFFYYLYNFLVYNPCCVAASMCRGSGECETLCAGALLVVVMDEGSEDCVVDETAGTATLTMRK